MSKLNASDYPDDEIIFQCKNLYAERPIYFISDVPHRVKTSRICIEKFWESSEFKIYDGEFLRFYFARLGQMRAGNMIT